MTSRRKLRFSFPEFLHLESSNQSINAIRLNVRIDVELSKE